MNDEEIIRVDSEELKKFIVDIFITNGIPTSDATVIANHLIKANLRGVDTHGVIRLKGYIDRIKFGGNNKTPTIKIINETRISAVMDGDNSFGQVGGQVAMELAIKKAKKNGMGIVVMRNSNHYGMAAFYSLMPLEYNMIGISMSNVLACMAPTGGIAARIGNNPVSIAIPAGGKLPIVLDMATSKSSWGKALICKQKGIPLPENSFLDEFGTSTIDPEAFLSGGTLIPIAEYKGYGIALVISCFCALLSNGKFDIELPHLYKKLEEPGENSFFMAAININNFLSEKLFKKRVDEVIDVIKSTPTKQNLDEVYLPGEKEFREEEKRKLEGIPIEKSLLKEIMVLAQRSNIDLSTYNFFKNINEI